MAVNILYGNEVYADNIPRTQVYQATHNENDEQLKYMHRSFISFSFGGKWIEDFNLIAVTNGDRMQRSGSGSFEDLVTNYEVLDGQFYWGTHYLNNQLQLSLATDSMTQIQLDNFLHWFAGGCTRELILAEHPNRAIMARIAEPPALSLLPFEKKLEVELNDTKYKTSTTEYKGEIGLSFIMDEPFWYAKNILLTNSNNQDLADKWIAANGSDEIGVYSDSDAIKVIVEDGVPTIDMIQAPIFMGKNVVLNYDYSITAGQDTQQKQSRTTNVIKNNDGIPVAAASNDQDTAESALGIIGARIEPPTNSTVKKSLINSLYYPGTAPVSPIVQFKFKISFNNDGYINIPYNSFTNPSCPYNVLTFESINKYELKFSLPGAFMAYNKAINIVRSSIGKTGAEIKKLILNNVKHAVIRGYAMRAIDDRATISSSNISTVINTIKSNCGFDDENTYSSVCINCKTGKATGTLSYNNAVEEDVGDMIKSNYLLLRDRNYPNKKGEIVERNNKRISREELQMTESQYEEYIKGYAYDVSFSDECKNNMNNLIITYDYLYY